MFKFVVLAALVAVATAAPGHLVAAPVVAHAVSTSHQSSSVVHHATPVVRTHVVAAPVVHAVHAAPVVHAVHAAPVVHAVPVVRSHAVHPVHAVHAVHPVHQVHAAPFVHVH